VLRHGVFDVDVVVCRSVVYGGLVLGIAALYAVVASVPGLALGRYVPVELAVVLTILVALVFQPVRARLDALADRWAFGHRVDRTELLMTLGAALEQTVDVTELMPRIAAAVRVGLGTPWVRVGLVGSREEVVSGSMKGTGPAELEVALERGGEVLGWVACGPRGHDGSDYTERERELLHRLPDRPPRQSRTCSSPPSWPAPASGWCRPPTENGDGSSATSTTVSSRRSSRC
jgi:hypothetical protein